MLVGKQLLLEELSSDLRRELSDLKKEGRGCMCTRYNEEGF